MKKLKEVMSGAGGTLAKTTVAQRFLIVALLIGLVFVIKTPPLWGGDETSHYARAYQVSQGNLVADFMPYPYGGKSYGGKVPRSVYDLIWHTNGDIENDPNATPFGTHRIDDIHSYSKFTHKKLGKADTDYFFPNTAAYSPLAYIPSAIGLRIAQIFNASVGQSIFIARLLGLLFFVSCVYWALKSLERKRFAWVIFAAALIPTAIFQASIISADLMANGLAILLTAFVTKALFDKRLTKMELSVALIAAAALPLIKPTYIFASLITLLIPREAIVKNFKINSILLKILVLVVGIIGLVGWTYLTAGVSEEIRRMGIGPRWVYIDPSAQTQFVLTHPTAIFTAFFRSLILTDNTYIGGLFGQFGFDFIQVPMTSILASLIAIFVALGASETLVLLRTKTLMAIAILLAGIASIFGTLYITFSNLREPIIEGVQGRYFMPFVPLALLILVMVNTRLKLDTRDSNKQWIFNFITILCATSLLLSAFKFLYVMLG